MIKRTFIITIPWPTWSWSWAKIWGITWRVAVLFVLCGSGSIIAVELLPDHKYSVGLAFGVFFAHALRAFGWGD